MTSMHEIIQNLRDVWVRPSTYPLLSAGCATQWCKILKYLIFVRNVKNSEGSLLNLYSEQLLIHCKDKTCNL